MPPQEGRTPSGPCPSSPVVVVSKGLPRDVRDEGVLDAGAWDLHPDTGYFLLRRSPCCRTRTGVDALDKLFDMALHPLPSKCASATAADAFPLSEPLCKRRLKVRAPLTCGTLLAKSVKRRRSEPPRSLPKGGFIGSVRRRRSRGSRASHGLTWSYTGPQDRWRDHGTLSTDSGSDTHPPQRRTTWVWTPRGEGPDGETPSSSAVTPVPP